MEGVSLFNMGKSYMEGVSLLEILIWVSPNKSGILVPLLFTKTKQHVILKFDFFFTWE